MSDDSPTQRPSRQAAIYRFSTAKMLVALIMLIATSPFIDKFEHGFIINAVLMSLVLITATMAMGNRRWTLIVAILLGAPALLARWANHMMPQIVQPEIFSVVGLLFVAFIAANLFRFILTASRVDYEVLCAGISGYLLLGLLWAFAYSLVATLIPGSFAFSNSPADIMQGFTAMYFSFCSLCTLGYGDIIPIKPVARMLAMMEGMTGIFYVAIMIARLVALSSISPSRQDLPK